MGLNALKTIGNILCKTTLRLRPKSPLRTRDEYEFQPGYLEIVERPPAPWARCSVLLLVALLVITLVWSIVGHLDIHANATGRLIISSHSKVIQSLEAGEVSAINVRDGQRVKRGDVLLSLNSVGVEAEQKELQEQLGAKRLEQARLIALLSDAPVDRFVPPTDAAPHQVALAREHLAISWQEVKAKLANLEGEMAVNKANQQSRSADIISLEKIATNVKTRLAANRALATNRLLPKIELLVQEKEWLEIERASIQQHAELVVLKAQYQTLQEQRDSYQSQLRREYYDRLSETRTSITVMEQQLIKVTERQRLQHLLAPVDGVVQQLAIHTLGGVVQSAQQLMVIVPDDAELEAEVMVLNKDIGFVYAGQVVELKIDSFPYTRYGTIRGQVSHVSKDAVKDEQQGLVFPARVAMTHSSILVEAQQIPLQAGMSVMAEIRTGDRRVIDYLLSPLQQYQSEAMRER